MTSPATSSAHELRGTWRRLLLLGLPAVGVAIVLGVALGRPDVWDRVYDPALYAGLGAALAFTWGAAYTRKLDLRTLTLVLICATGAYVPLKLLLLAVVRPPPQVVLVEALEVLVWLPTVITWAMVTDLSRPVRAVLNATLATVAALSAVLAVTVGAGQVTDMARTLLQVNFSAALALYAATSFVRRQDALGRLQGERDALRRLAFTDILTALPGRRALEQQLARLTRPGSPPLGLLFVDVDAFKVVNDTLGHDAGDRLLRVLAGELQRLAGPGALVYRLSGDEFVVLLPGMDGPQAEHVAREVQRGATAAPSAAVGVETTVSIGLSVYPVDATQPEDLLRHADAAMYAVKRAGRRQVRRYHSTQDAETERFQLLAGELGHALPRGELRVVYQPVYDLSTLRPVKVEALVRWTHPTLGPVSPAEFVPVAERVGAITPIGTWVLRTACHAARAWPDLRVSVNVSAVQVLQADFPDVVLGALLDAGMEPGRLELELTETALLYEDERAARALARMKDAGVGVSVDDFGSGYSNLMRLRRLPITGIKVDRSITGDLDGTDAFGRGLLQALVGIASNLGVQLTAEGLETGSQLDVVQALGCRYGQGYVLSRPVEAAQVPLLRPADTTADRGGGT